MSGKKSDGAGAGERKCPSAGETASRCGCSCEPRRCVPLVAAVLAVVAVPLVIGAVRRSRGGRKEGAPAGKPAGCCA